MDADPIGRFQVELRRIRVDGNRTDERTGWIGGKLSSTHSTTRRPVSSVGWFLLVASVVVILAIVVSPWVGVVVGGISSVVPDVITRRRRRRRDARIVASLPVAIEMVARSLRSGSSFMQGLREAARDAPAPVAHALVQIVRAVDRGTAVEVACRSWATGEHVPEVRVVAAALALASQNAAGASRSLDGVAATLRERSALDAEIAALTAQATASTRALVMVPLGYLVIDGLVGRHALGFLVGDAFGRTCLSAGLGLEVLGWLWMRALVLGHRS